MPKREFRAFSGSLSAKRAELLRAHGAAAAPTSSRHSLRLAASWAGGASGSCSMRPPGLALAAAFLVVAVASVLAGAAPFPAALTLERALPHKGVPAEHLKERDRARHAGRGLLGPAPAVAGVVDFPVEGSANPYMVGWVSCFASIFF